MKLTSQPLKGCTSGFSRQGVQFSKLGVFSEVGGLATPLSMDSDGETLLVGACFDVSDRVIASRITDLLLFGSKETFSSVGLISSLLSSRIIYKISVTMECETMDSVTNLRVMR